MTDTSLNRMYKRLAKHLAGTRKTLTQACIDAGIDIEDVDDAMLNAAVVECSHCGIWGTSHKEDDEGFPVCGLCFRLVGK
jgi:hypothetical protein